MALKMWDTSVRVRTPNVKPVIFLRDNIFRAVQQLDPDYSRNIEGGVLHLHWDVHSLWRFATNRIKCALHIPHESAPKIWNAATAADLRGREGFHRCLQHTLYRPRDLLALLNEAYYDAAKNNQRQIVGSNLDSAARLISRTRLDDLRKEYHAIFPALPAYISAFHGRERDLSVATALDLLASTVAAGSDDSLVQQDFYILQEPWDILRALYGVGFLGVRDATAGTFVFCHDGRAPDREFARPDRVLVHPCYWLALNCTSGGIEQQDVEEIYDEYDIAVSSQTPLIRNAKITDLIDTLGGIPLGTSGANAFETWCHNAIRICFAKGLRNVDLKPNRGATSRRDVVATNLGEAGAWRRIYDDYGTRQVTFEIKNTDTLTAADYQQVQSYLTGPYGKVAFVVTRSDTEDLYKGRDVDWVRDLYAQHQALVIKLTANFFQSQLSKLRSPGKHEAVDDSIHRLLDTYSRLYVAGQPTARRPRRRSKSRRRKSRSSAG